MYKAPTIYRNYYGTIYERDSVFKTPRRQLDAQERAEELRETGVLARVVYRKYDAVVYANRKHMK